MCKTGNCSATLLEATAYGGTAKGKMSLARGARGLTAQATLSLADVDLGAASAEFGWTGFHGRGDLDANLRTIGFAASDSVLTLAGQANATLAAGSFDGFSVEEALRRGQRRPIDVARDLADGATHFLRGRVRLSFAGGVATIDEGRIEGPGSAVDLAGTIDVASRTWQAQARAVQADAEGGPSPDAARLTIVLSGPWSAPNVSAAPGG
jgi:uncharacterized protein involved in outer membrane biogenesis